MDAKEDDIFLLKLISKGNEQVLNYCLRLILHRYADLYGCMFASGKVDPVCY